MCTMVRQVHMGRGRCQERCREVASKEDPQGQVTTKVISENIENLSKHRKWGK